MLTLPPSAFDNDRGVWGIDARAALLAGRRHGARTSLRRLGAVAFEAQLRATPDGRRRGTCFAGWRSPTWGSARPRCEEGERGLALAQATGIKYNAIPYARILCWRRIYVLVGDHPHALDQLDSLLAKPFFISPAWLKIDPTWAPLRGDPRFERLLAQPPTLIAQ